MITMYITHWNIVHCTAFKLFKSPTIDEILICTKQRRFSDSLRHIFLKAQVDKGRKKIRIELYPRDTWYTANRSGLRDLERQMLLNIFLLFMCEKINRSF